MTDDSRFALCQRAGFIDDQRVDFLQRFQSFGVLDEDASMRAPAGANHDCHRGCQS